MYLTDSRFSRIIVVGELRPEESDPETAREKPGPRPRPGDLSEAGVAAAKRRLKALPGHGVFEYLMGWGSESCFVLKSSSKRELVTGTSETKQNIVTEWTLHSVLYVSESTRSPPIPFLRHKVLV